MIQSMARGKAARAQVTSDGQPRPPEAATQLTLRRSHAHLCDLVDECTPCGASRDADAASLGRTRAESRRPSATGSPLM